MYGFSGAKRLAAVGELDRELVVAERVGVDTGVVPRHHERGARLAGVARRLGEREHAAQDREGLRALDREARVVEVRDERDVVGQPREQRGEVSGRVARDRRRRARATSSGSVVARACPRRAARARRRARRGACSAISPTTSSRTSRLRRGRARARSPRRAGAGGRARSRGSRSRRSSDRTTARGAAGARRPPAVVGSSGSCSSATSIEHAGELAPAPRALADRPRERGLLAVAAEALGERVAREHERLGSPVGRRARLDRVVDGVEPRPRDRAGSR